MQYVLSEEITDAFAEKELKGNAKVFLHLVFICYLPKSYFSIIMMAGQMFYEIENSISD